MKTFIFILLASLFVSNAFVQQPAEESPELKEATELTKSVAKLFNEQKFDEALALAKRSLEIRERLLPRTDPRVGQSLAHVGDLYIAKHDYDSARKIFERLLAIQEERFGPDDVNLAFVFDRLAVLYNRDGKPAKTEEFYQRALAVREKAFGPEHVEVAETLYALGQFYRIRREYTRAHDSYKRSLLIYGRTGGVTSTEYNRANTGLSCLGYETGNKAIFKELEDIQQQFAPGLPMAPPKSILNGLALTLAKPEYPLAARNMGLRGSVVVNVELDETGKVISAKDVCQGLPFLSESALRAALKSRFSPTKISGVPVKTTGVIVYNFLQR
ncbi:MAG TPA: TonB family protein [Pyrinomonadaceae bacterium]|nr:TonB family protein [Pyrinomonadaceae bacterium]